MYFLLRHLEPTSLLVFLRIDRPLIEMKLPPALRFTTMTPIGNKIQLTRCCLYMVLSAVVQVTVLSLSVEYTRVRCMAVNERSTKL